MGQIASGLGNDVALVYICIQLDECVHVQA